MTLGKVKLCGSSTWPSLATPRCDAFSMKCQFLYTSWHPPTSVLGIGRKSHQQGEGWGSGGLQSLGGRGQQGLAGVWVKLLS